MNEVLGFSGIRSRFALGLSPAKPFTPGCSLPSFAEDRAEMPSKTARPPP